VSGQEAREALRSRAEIAESALEDVRAERDALASRLSELEQVLRLTQAALEGLAEGIAEHLAGSPAEEQEGDEE
jgi:hypothetical protein